MDEKTEEEVLHQLKWENRMLKQRVFELEEKLQKHGVPPDPKQETRLLKLLQQKDLQLEQYATELEQKRDELKKTIQDLEKRNEQLALWMASMRLYQDIFENESSVMIGVNQEGKVVLFNRSAAQILGEKIKDALHRPIDQVDFAALDPAIPRRVKEALGSGKLVMGSVQVKDRRVSTTAYPLGSATERAGVLVKITVTPEK